MSSDETNLFISDENIGKQLPEIIEELKGASVWFKTNSLLILMKPNWLYFTPVVMPTIFEELSIDGRTLERETATKFLGVLIDEKVPWETQPILKPFPTRFLKT